MTCQECLEIITSRTAWKISVGKTEGYLWVCTPCLNERQRQLHAKEIRELSISDAKELNEKPRDNKTST